MAGAEHAGAAAPAPMHDGSKAFLSQHQATGPSHLHGGVAMAQICCHARNVRDIIERELAHELVHLQQQRQRLADAAGCPKQGYFELRLHCGHAPACPGNRSALLVQDTLADGESASCLLDALESVQTSCLGWPLCLAPGALPLGSALQD